MENYLTYFIETILCAGICYAFYHWVLKKEKCFGFNRAYLLIALLSSILFPLLSFPLFTSASNPLTVNQSLTFIGTFSISPAATQGNTSWSWETILWAMYGSGVLLLIGRFMISLGGLLFFILKSEKSKLSNENIYWINTEGKYPTLSFFHYIFWDNTRELNDYQISQILLHEKVHIRQGHSYDNLVMTLIQIIFWFNPLIFLYKKALNDVHEFIADNEVQRTKPDAYLNLVSKLAIGYSNPSLANTFNQSQILKRITMMNTKRKNTPKIKPVMALMLVMALFFIFSCDQQEIMQKTDSGQSKWKTLDGTELPFEEPVPPGGNDPSFDFIYKNLNYPEEAKQKGMEGVVFVEFEVNKDGSITNVKALKSTNKIFNEEAKSVIAETSNWNPAIKDGEPIQKTMVIPIKFKLPKN